MSRAFVKEPDGGAPEELPERQVSPHRNFVTPEGLVAIDAEIARLEAGLADAGDDAARQVRIARDLRYWRSRRSTAEVVAPPAEASQVRFGSTVAFVRDDGRTQTFRIVGEDEADPAKGSVSYVSPLARALMGKAVGDVVAVAGGEAEIVAIA
jgi:transcription elongation GreA/GreB family factor